VNRWLEKQCGTCEHFALEQIEPGLRYGWGECMLRHEVRYEDNLPCEQWEPCAGFKQAELEAIRGKHQAATHP